MEKKFVILGIVLLLLGILSLFTLVGKFGIIFILIGFVISLYGYFYKKREGYIDLTNKPKHEEPETEAREETGGDRLEEE